ncbi:helix-turn-helix domain-containing protein [Bacillus salipaludis]|uniref:Helix-turn-helix domain-containing protein n=1 Tax=Bacillus salipaludis TaxID=2547811 RepID=A0ABW8RNX1_9BACI
MYFNNNLKKFMKENEISLNQLANICELSINTLRELKNNPSHNTNLSSLVILAQALDCSIKDLIEDDIATINFEKVAEKNKNNRLFIRQQVFSPENVQYLRNLFLQVGVPCNISSYGRYKTASVKNEYELSSIKVDFNLRVLDLKECTILQIVDFYVSVNQLLLNEAVIKDTLIKAFETYARKLKLNQIHFIIDRDYERQDDQYSNEHSELQAYFTYTLGTESMLFVQNNYERSPFPELEEYQIEWRKTLS